MKNLLSCALMAGLLLALPSLSLAKGSKTKLSVKGVVTAVTEKSITIKEGKKQGGGTKTISVPPGTPIKEKSVSAAPPSGSTPPKSGSATPTPGTTTPPSGTATTTPGTATPPSGSAAPTLSQLVGKHVKIQESSEGTAREIMVRQHGGKKHKGKKKA